jgi:hypothetical protein
MPFAVVVNRRKTRILGRPARPWRPRWLGIAGYLCKKKPSRQQKCWAPIWRRALPKSVGRSIALPAGDATQLSRPAADLTRISRGASLMSITSNLTWFRGEDITLDLQMVPPLTDITGWNIQFTLKDTLGGTTQPSFPLTASIVDGPRGKFRVSIPSGLTASLAVGRYVWDCRRTDTGKKTTLADGYLDLRQEITP